MKITHETRRESYEQLDPSGRKAAILAELERGDGTALEIMRRMGFTDPNRVRPRLNGCGRCHIQQKSPRWCHYHQQRRRQKIYT